MASRLFGFSFGPANGLVFKKLDARGAMNSPCIPADVIREFAVRADEDVLIKHTTSAFNEGHLEEALHTKYGARGVLVSGGMVSVCVQDTLRGATRRGFDELGHLRPYVQFITIFVTDG